MATEKPWSVKREQVKSWRVAVLEYISVLCLLTGAADIMANGFEDAEWTLFAIAIAFVCMVVV